MSVANRFENGISRSLQASKFYAYELESQFGFRLFNRNHQIVELTDAGRAGSGANNFDGQNEVLEKGIDRYAIGLPL